MKVASRYLAILGVVVALDVEAARAADDAPRHNAIPQPELWFSSQAVEWADDHVVLKVIARVVNSPSWTWNGCVGFSAECARADTAQARPAGTAHAPLADNLFVRCSARGAPGDTVVVDSRKPDSASVARADSAFYGPRPDCISVTLGPSEEYCDTLSVSVSVAPPNWRTVDILARLRVWNNDGESIAIGGTGASRDRGRSN